MRIVIVWLYAFTMLFIISVGWWVSLPVVLAVSTSLKNVGPVIIATPTTTTTTFTSSLDRGMEYGNDGDYNIAWSKTTADIISYDDPPLGQVLAMGYTVFRYFEFFDTSSIPDDATVSNIILSIYIHLDWSDQDFDVTIMGGLTTYPHLPLQTIDYNKTYYTLNGGSRSTSEITGEGTYFNITFSSDELPFGMNVLDWINKEGITKLCLRSSRDINGIAPSPGVLEFLDIDTNDRTCPAKLYVTYTYLTYSNQMAPQGLLIATAVEYVNYVWGPLFDVFIILWALLNSQRKDVESEVYGY